MSTELSFKTAICTEYEDLLFACQKALETWRERREETTLFRFDGRSTGEELLRLQAEYARSYSRLERHADNCELCSFVSRVGSRNRNCVAISVPDTFGKTSIV